MNCIIFRAPKIFISNDLWPVHPIKQLCKKLFISANLNSFFLLIPKINSSKPDGC